MSTTPAGREIGGDAPEMALHERSRYRAAAGRPRRIHPGPVGELVFRELTAYAEFGHRFGDGLIPRLAAAVLATRSDHGPLTGRTHRDGARR